MIGAVVAGLLSLLALSIPVGIVLFLLGFGVDAFFSSFPLSRRLGNMVWSSSNSAALVAIPFFACWARSSSVRAWPPAPMPRSTAG